MWHPCGYRQEVGWEGADPGINQLDARVCGVMEEQVGPPPRIHKKITNKCFFYVLPLL